MTPVAKVIRLCDLALVHGLLDKFDLRIILLVRDPRAITASKLAIYMKDSYRSACRIDHFALLLQAIVR